MATDKCKFTSLTHYIRRKYAVRSVRQILNRCDVSPRLGCLPPQLCERVPVAERANVTYQFSVILENFVAENRNQMVGLVADTSYQVPEIENLFHTKCFIVARGMNIMGFSPWSGGFGLVCKVYFPEIDVKYALKCFILEPEAKSSVHGADFEIPTAIAANHAEPRDNCPIYMASLVKNREFMLSLWGGNAADGKIRQNKNEIFVTNPEEAEGRNYRQGRRIDFGDTYMTEYGAHHIMHVNYTDKFQMRHNIMIPPGWINWCMPFVQNMTAVIGARQ